MEFADTDSLKDLGITVVDLTEIKGANGTHSKFAGSPEIVQALGNVLRAGGSVNTSGVIPPGVEIVRGVSGIPTAILGGGSAVFGDRK